MTLLLHVNAQATDYDGLRQLETPPPTATHVPIPHFRVVDLLKTTLGMFGHSVIQEHHGTTADGMRYFGLLSLRSPYTGYEDTVGIRNSHDKSFPVGVGFGSRVFVCDNMSFVADHVIKLKHTAKLKLTLPGVIGELIEPLALQRERQHHQINRYKRTMLTRMHADHAIMGLYRMQVIGVQQIAHVNKEWENPTFEEFNEDRSAWRLFNAVTFALNGRVMDNSTSTPKLHEVIDSVCEEIGYRQCL